MKNIVLRTIITFIVISHCTCCTREKFCITYTVPLNKISPYYDGQWQGIIAASDGACYFGSASHTLVHGGGFFRFNPGNQEFEVLTDDFTKLVGDDLSEHTPQGKCHSPIIETDGTLYLATHLAAYWTDVLDKYAGSYLLSYNLKDKKWTNYGINKPRFTTYSAIEIDPARQKAYVMLVPFAPEDTAEGSHLFEVNLRTKERRDLGRLSQGRASFWFYLDDTGKLWTSIWKGKSVLHCYDPELDSILTYQNVFPEPRLAPDGNLAVKPTNKEISWTWATPIDGRRKCLFTMGDQGGGDERLWLFDSHKDIASGAAFTPICFVGNTFLSVAIGGDRLYFIQRAINTSSRGYSNEDNWDLEPDKKGYHPNNLHLKSLSWNLNDNHDIVDHGRIIDDAGRTPGMIESLAADKNCNVFMSGSWLIKSGDQPTLQYNYDEKKFNALKRGEFFAWTNVSKDLK